MTNELTPAEEVELARRNHPMMPGGVVPPLPANRVTQHIEEDLAYRSEYTVMKGTDMTKRLARGVADIHNDNMRRAKSDPVLGQLLLRIETTLTVAACELIESYLKHQGE